MRKAGSGFVGGRGRQHGEAKRGRGAHDWRQRGGVVRVQQGCGSRGPKIKLAFLGHAAAQANWPASHIYAAGGTSSPAAPLAAGDARPDALHGRGRPHYSPQRRRRAVATQPAHPVKASKHSNVSLLSLKLPPHLVQVLSLHVLKALEHEACHVGGHRLAAACAHGWERGSARVVRQRC